MSYRRISILFFSLFLVPFFKAQEDSVKVEKFQISNVMVGVDLLNAGISFFSERQLFQGFISAQLKKDIYGVIDLGHESNVYDKNGYDAKASGLFVKAGGYYMLMKDNENPLNGFYAGPKVGASFYSQTYDRIPVRGSGGGDSFVSLETSNQTSLWLEAQIGGKVQLFQSPFYIDLSVQPRYLIYTTKQEGVQPMIVPGFGKSSSSFNVGFAWNLAYHF